MVNSAGDASEGCELVSCDFTVNASQLAHESALAHGGKAYERDSGVSVFDNIEAIAGDTEKGRERRI